MASYLVAQLGLHSQREPHSRVWQFVLDIGWAMRLLEVI